MREIQLNCRYGEWLVISGEFKHKGRICLICRCVCGTEKAVQKRYLIGGRSLSCGCVQRKLLANRSRKSGSSKKSVYFAWQGMLNRCRNKNISKYSYYGGRGIKVCERWATSFENFIHDMGDRPEGMTIERVDVNGDYCPENCKWDSRMEQMRTIRSRSKWGIKGVVKRANGWAVYIGLNYKKIYVGCSTDFFEACCMRKSSEIKLWGNN